MARRIPGTVAWGDSASMRPGDEVVAIGTPYGEFNNTVSDGMIGAVDGDLNSGSGYSLPNLIQHDAAIYPGNSGGPLEHAGPGGRYQRCQGLRRCQQPVHGRGIQLRHRVERCEGDRR